MRRVLLKALMPVHKDARLRQFKGGTKHAEGNDLCGCLGEPSRAGQEQIGTCNENGGCREMRHAKSNMARVPETRKNVIGNAGGPAPGRH